MSATENPVGYSDEGRIIRITTPLKEDLVVRQLSVREGVSQLFCMNADVYSESSEIDFDKIIGQPVSLYVKMPSGNGRFFHGIVSKFSQHETLGSVTAYGMEIVPWLWMLSRNQNCKIFSDESVSTILQAVFENLEMSDFEFRAIRDPAKAYCVQYRESDFSFCSRIMEEAGLGYYFEHGEKYHKLIIFDSRTPPPVCASNAEVEFGADSNQDSVSLESNCISQFHMERAFHPGKFTITDYDFEDPGDADNPGRKLLSSLESEITVGQSKDMEVFDYPGQYAKIDDGDELLKQHVAVAKQEYFQVTAASSCIGFTPGYTFEMSEHPRESYNSTYLITEITHLIVQETGISEIANSQSYQNDLKCIPSGSNGIPFVPAQKTPKPKITGVQTATVVSPDGNEIDVDDFGRVLVKFPWDRSSDQNSGRVRVSQNRAGSGWGDLSFPHPGQEVLVGFMEGDPSRPIIVGRVYNANNMPVLNTGSCTQTKNSDHAGNYDSKEGKAGEETNVNFSIFGNSSLCLGASFGAGLLAGVLCKTDENISLDCAKDNDVKIGGRQDVAVTGPVAITHNNTTHWDFIGDTYKKTFGSTDEEFIGRKFEKFLGHKEEIFIGLKSSLFVGGQLNTTVAAKRDVNLGGYWTHNHAGEFVKAKKFEQNIYGNYISDVTGDVTFLVGGIFKIKVGDSTLIMTKNTIELKAKQVTFISTGGPVGIVSSEDIILDPKGKISDPKGKLNAKHLQVNG